MEKKAEGLQKLVAAAGGNPDAAAARTIEVPIEASMSVPAKRATD